MNDFVANHGFYFLGAFFVWVGLFLFMWFFQPSRDSDGSWIERKRRRWRKESKLADRLLKLVERR